MEESYHCLFVTVVVLLSIQTILMIIPVGTAGTIYIQNKAVFDALGDRVKDVSVIPVQNITSQAQNSIQKASHILNEVDHITNDYENHRDMMDDLHLVIKKSFFPMEGMSDLLKLSTRKDIKKSVHKIQKLLSKLSDNDIERLVKLVDKSAIQALHALSDPNINKTMHIVNDADSALKKFDKLISKLV